MYCIMVATKNFETLTLNKGIERSNNDSCKQCKLKRCNAMYKRKRFVKNVDLKDELSDVQFVQNKIGQKDKEEIFRRRFV